MSTLSLADALASVFVPIGIVGAVVAGLCALIAAVALAFGAAGLAGGAIGVWIVGALLSIAGSFAGVWMPLHASLLALGAALIAGGAVRVISVRRRVTAAQRGVAASAAAELPRSSAAPVLAASVLASSAPKPGAVVNHSPATTRTAMGAVTTDTIRAVA